MARAGEYLFGPIRRVIEERTMKIFHEGLTIVPAKLGNDAGIIGSAALALDKAAELSLTHVSSSRARRIEMTEERSARCQSCLTTTLR